MPVVIGLILAFVLMIVFRSRRSRACRWRAERSGDCGRLAKYRCASCGAEAFTDTGRPPEVCHATSGERSL